jgi:hypothetical protein
VHIQSAYFVAVDDSHGVSIEVFGTKEQAGAAAPGVTLGLLQFDEVIGSA